MFLQKSWVRTQPLQQWITAPHSEVKIEEKVKHRRQKNERRDVRRGRSVRDAKKLLIIEVQDLRE